MFNMQSIQNIISEFMYNIDISHLNQTSYTSELVYLKKLQTLKSMLLK